MRGRWSRLSLSLLASHCRRTRRSALEEMAAARATRRATTPLPIHLERLPSESLARALDIHQEDDLVWAAQLGLDLATFQMLRQLEQRDILPEDYDLLGRLDESLKPKTLDSEDLARFEIRTYQPPLRPVVSLPDSSSLNFSDNISQLPSTTSAPAADTHCFGVAFWKLPMPALEDDGASTCVSDEDGSSGNSSTMFNTCGVCLVDFQGGEEIRTLPCGHLFHRECIDHWLLNCSISCPVDKLDVI